MDEQTKWTITTVIAVIVPLAAVVLDNWLKQRKPFIKRQCRKHKR